MKIEDIEKANDLVRDIKQLESLIEGIRSSTVVRLLTARFDGVWSSDVESDRPEITALNQEFKNNLLSYYDVVLCNLKLELDKL